MALARAAMDIKAKDFKGFYKKVKSVADYLTMTRPTAVNIHWAMKRMLGLLEKNSDRSIPTLKELLVEEAKAILEEDIETNRAIGVWGARFIRDGDTIMTHCNAGALATGGYGTATAPILVAKEQGKNIRVIANETRPVLQGARLTAWELMQAGIDVTLVTDNSAGALMRLGEVDLCIVGTDRTALNGDVANKIGTYSLAVLARENGVAFYVAAPLSSIDPETPSGDMIPIEERPPEEVTIIKGQRIAPEGVKVRNMAFDVTPARYITAIITEKGAFRPRDIRKLFMDGINLDEVRL
jgi:methylthioribose-1-phosphate isomerase